MLSTALADMFGLQHPIILGPMGGVAGGREIMELSHKNRQRSAG